MPAGVSLGDRAPYLWANGKGVSDLERSPSASTSEGGLEMTKRVVALFLAVTLAVAVVSAGVAVGAKSFKTKVTIVQGDSSNFHGKVKSKKAACKKKRKVKLQEQGVYPNPPSSFHTIGKTKSNKRGKWKVATAPVSGDHYRAKVAKKKLPNNKGKCKPATSKVITAS